MKKVLKSRVFLCILLALIIGIAGVSAATYFPSNDVTYDNTDSGLQSMNVQGAIDELYSKAQQCSNNGKVNEVIDNIEIVNSGDGLYKDVYEDGRYFYKGTNPNNYITFNGEKAGWRIISLEPDGTIKIMKIESLDDMLWDVADFWSSKNNWTKPSGLNTYLNETYYNSLTSIAQSQITSHEWKIGPVLENNDSLTDNVNAEGEITWKGKIGLITVSEFLRANSNVGNCRTLALINNGNGNCSSTSWMATSKYYWTISAKADWGTTSVYQVASAIQYRDANSSASVKPTLYLSSSVKLSGSGTLSDPYTLSV